MVVLYQHVIYTSISAFYSSQLYSPPDWLRRLDPDVLSGHQMVGGRDQAVK